MRVRWLNLILMLAMLMAALPAGVAVAAPTTQQPQPAPRVAAQPVVPAAASDAPAAASTPTQQQPAIEVEPALAQQMTTSGSSGYLIYFRDRPDLSAAGKMDWNTRGEFVMKSLQDTANKSQARVKSFLDSEKIQYKSFWIDNVILVEQSDQKILSGLMDFSEISALRTRRTEMVYEPTESSAASPNLLDLFAVEPNLTHVQAPGAWALGYTGQGMVVSSVDTGVRYTHQALNAQYRGNLGGGTYDNNYNWWDPYGDHPTAPADDNGHGSHTMGIMLGTDGGANQTGMAPGAKWMACRGCNTNNCTDTALLECAQFLAAPWNLSETNPDPTKRPNVVNNSWGDCSQSYDPWYQGVVDSWQAAGIYPVFSNGNSSNCGYSTPPACGTVGNPGRYGNVTGVGATGTSNGAYATFSNRGPTDRPDTINPNGYPTIKPQVAAPGQSIRSSYNASDTSYQLMSGTSMSAPHVTGLVALAMSAGQCLVGDYAAVETLIEEHATPITTGLPGTCTGEGPGQLPNQSTGWGEINALAVVQAAATACGPTGTLAGHVQDAGTNAAIANAQIVATLTTTRTWTATTNAQGDFSMVVPEGAYTVDAMAYGYLPVQLADVVVSEGQTTQLTIPMTLAPSATVAGQVTDAAAGWPLYTKITIDGNPNTFWTDPATGMYSIVLPVGSNYTFHFAAFSQGYLPAQATVTALPEGGVTLDQALQADATACNAPGYVLDVTGVYETFEGATFPPAGWTVTRNGGSCDWVGNDPGARGNKTGGSGKFAIADSDRCGTGTTMNTTLTSPVMDVSSLANVNFSYAFDYYNLSSSESADLDVSADGGATWTSVHHWNSSHRGPGTFAQDITALVGGSTQAQLRFHYVAPGWDWWWQVDDVFVGEKVCHPIPGGGLVVGRVADANDNHALVGATVTSADGGSATTAATPLDPALGDFYALYQPAGAHDLTAIAQHYSPATASVTVPLSNTIRQDFALSTGHLEYTPPQINKTLAAGQSLTVPVTVTNTGGGAVSFEIFEIDKSAVPFGSTEGNKAAKPGQVTIGDSFAANPNPPKASSNPESLLPKKAPEGSVTLTESASQTIISGNSVSCNASGLHADNDYLRVFDLPTFGITSPFAVSNVSFGIETSAPSGSTQPVVVRLYTLNGSLAWANMTLIGTANANVPAQQLTIFNVPVTGLAPAGSKLVVDIFTPSGQSAGNSFFIGSNNLGQTAPSYLAAVDCGVPEPTDTATIGFPGMHIVMNVTGSAGGGDVPWLSESPTQVTLAPGASTTINVTLDSIGVRPGVYGAALQFAQDTPYDLPDMPVTMTVSIPPTWGKLSGVVTTNGYCDANPAPLGGVPVIVNSAAFSVPLQLTTAADGSYYVWLDQADSPLTVDVSAGADYATGSATGIVLHGQQTTIQDFTLRYLKPCMEVDPSAYTVNLGLGQTTTRQLKLTNEGGGTADFTVTDSQTGGPMSVPDQAEVVHTPADAGKAPAPTAPGQPESPNAGVLAGAPAFAINLNTQNLVSFNTSTPGTATVIGSVGGNYFAGDFLGGDFTKLYSLSYDNNQFVTFNTTNAAKTVIGTATPQSGQTWAGLTGAPGNKFYAIGTACGSSSTLYTINPTTGAATVIGSLGSAATCAIDVAASPTGDLYSVDLVTDNLVRVDKNTGAATTIGSIGFPANYAQGMDFDNASGTLYLAAYNYNGVSGQGELRTADTTTGATTLIGTFPSGNEYDDLAIATGGGGGGGDAKWLTEAPAAGTVAPDGETYVTVTFDANQVNKPGQYLGTVSVASNDTENTPIPVAVTFNVNAPANWGILKGTVTDLGYCDAGTGPLKDATVLITASTGMTRSLTTPNDGSYFLWLPDYGSPYTVKVTAQDHLDAQVGGVAVVGQGTTVQDMSLHLNKPCVHETPAGLSATVAWQASATRQMTLTNTGWAATPFKISEVPGIFIPMSVTGNQLLIVNGGAYNTSAANAMKTAVTNLGYTSDLVSTLPANLSAYLAVLYAGVPSSTEQTALMAYLDAGGRLLVADNDLGYSLNSTTFYKTYLEATYVTDSGSDGTINGVDIEAGVNADISADPYPDSFKIGPDAVGIFANTSPRVDWAGMRIARNAYKAVYFAWDYYYAGGSTVGDPIETAIMAPAMQWLAASDVKWLSESPSQGNLAANTGSQLVQVNFNANVSDVTQPGTYTAQLKIETDDPTNGTLMVPVTMIVNPSPTYGKVWGTVRTLGACDLAPAPINGAKVKVVVDGTTMTLTTDANGYYSYWFTVNYPTLAMYVTAAGNLEEDRAVFFYPGADPRNQQDFDLHLAQPCGALTPDSLTATVDLGSSVTLPAEIANTGWAPLNFTLRGSQTGFIPLNAPQAGDLLVVDSNSTSTNLVVASLARLGFTYDRVTTGALPPVGAWTNYKAVIWVGSPSGTANLTTIKSYLDAGGKFLIMYNDLGWAYYSDTFYTQYLEATYLLDSGSDGWVTGQDVMAGIHINISGDPYPDSFSINGSHAVAIFTNDAPNSNNSGLRIEKTMAGQPYKAIYLAWNFDYTGTTDAEKDAVLGNALNYLAPSANWIKPAPNAGTVPDHATQAVDVTLDAADPSITQPGTYQGVLNMSNNTPGHGMISIPVTMIVDPTATMGKLMGAVQGKGYCDASPAPLTNVPVVIHTGNGMTVTLKTDANGAYSYWFDEVANPLTIDVNVAEYEPGAATVDIDGGQTTTQNFSLRWLKPCSSTDPTSYDVKVRLGNTLDQPLTLFNNGALATTFALTKTARTMNFAQPITTAPVFGKPWGNVNLSATKGSSDRASTQAAPWSPTGNVGLVLDDGTAENSIGVTDGVSSYQFIWLNRFTPAADEFPFNLEQISILWPVGNANVGNPVEFVVYQDTDGDGNPANAQVMYTFGATVQHVDGVTWDNITLPTPLALGGPGDVLIGVINRWINTAVSPAQWPANIDTNASQGRSWIGWWNADPPEPPVLPPDLVFGTIDSQGFAGNWMIRGSGHTPEGNLAWLSTTPETGDLPADSSQAATVHFDATAATGLITQTGTYKAFLKFNTSDPVHPSISLPVTMTVGDVPTCAFTNDSPTLLGNATHFTNQSAGATTYLWDFGDGNQSTAQNPTHTYGAIGYYDVTLVATNEFGDSPSCTGTAIVQDLPTPDFTSDSPQKVGAVMTFTNTTPDAIPAVTAWLWDFGDGSPTETTEDVTHVFTIPGDHIVTLNAWNDLGFRSVTHTVVVLEHVYGLNVVPPADSRSAFPGDTVTFSLDVQNTGDGDDTVNVAVDSSVPPALAALIQINPASVPLAAGATGTVTVGGVIPANIGVLGLPGVAIGKTSSLTIPMVFKSVNDPTKTQTVPLTVNLKWHTLYLPFQQH